MPRSGSVGCLSKETISTAFDCILSCILFVAFIYIGLLILGPVSKIELDQLFYVIGYISIAVLFIVPIGLYGSSSGSYCSLICFFILASYLCYALTMYIWFNTRSSELFPGFYSNNKSGTATTNKTASGGRTGLRGFDVLHQLTCCSYTALVILSLLMVIFKIVSNVSQIEPARVIVVDNNPSE